MRRVTARLGLIISLLSLGLLVCTITDDAGSLVDPGNPLNPGPSTPPRQRPTILVSPDSSYVRLKDTLAIRVLVMADSIVTTNSSPLSGARVRVTSTAGWLSADTIVADINGRAIVYFSDSVRRENVLLQFTCFTATQSIRIDVTNAPTQIQKRIEATPERAVVKADGRDFTLINVRVMNENNNPLVGEAIQFITTAGLISGLKPTSPSQSGTSITDENGIASARLLSTAINDTAFVTAFLVSNRALSDETQVAFQGVTISVKADSSNLRTGAKTMLTAQVLNASNEPVARAPVFFTLVKGSASVLRMEPGMVDSLTGFDGIARAVIVGTATGTDSVIVSSSGAQTRTSINVSNLSLRTTVYPKTLQASKDTATLEIVFSNRDSALAMRPVTVIRYYPLKDGGNGTDTLRGTTDQAGMCRFRIPALAHDGIIRLQTTASNFSDEVATAENSVECITTRVMTMDAFPSAIKADGTDRSQITVQVKNENNNPIVGDEVTFISSAGVIAARAITDSTGRARAFLVSERRNALALVTAVLAKDRTKRDSILVEFSGVTLDLSANPTSINTYGTDSSLLRVTVLDAGKKPIAGEKVYFSHRKDTVYLTDTRGVAHATVKGTGALKLRDTVLASAAGAADTVIIRYSNNRIIISDTTPRPHIADGLDSTRIYIRYQTEGGQAISGILLRVSMTMGTVAVVGDTVFFDTMRTNGSGLVTFVIRNPSFPDSATVHVRASDPTETEGVRKLFFAADRIARIKLEGTPSVVGIAPGRATITATAFDAQGNRVSNAPIAFNMLRGPGGGTYLNPPVRTTGADGTARIELVSGSIPSSYNGVWVVAGDSGRIKSDTLKFTIAGPPASIAIRTNILKGINPNDGTFRLPCAALVSDINGNPVADGTPVTFSLKVSGYMTYPLKARHGYYFTDNAWWCRYDIEQDTALLLFEDFNDNFKLDPGEDRNGDGVASRGEDYNGDGRYCPGPKFIDINRNGKRDFNWFTPVEARIKGYCEDMWADMWANSLWDPIEPLEDTLYLRVYRSMRANKAFDRLLGWSITPPSADDLRDKAILDSLDRIYASGPCWDPVFGYDYDVNQNGAPDPNTSVNIKRTVQTIEGKATNEIQYGQSDARFIEVMIWAESQGVRTLSPEKLILPVIGDK